MLFMGWEVQVLAFVLSWMNVDILFKSVKVVSGLLFDHVEVFQLLLIGNH